MPLWTKWLSGIVATLLTAAVLGGATTLASHGQEIARTETRIDSIYAGQQRIETQQKILDKKLDRIYEILITR